MYQTQEIPAFTTRQQCHEATSSLNDQQYQMQLRTVQTDERIAVLVMLLGMVVIAVWALKFVYGM